MKKAILTVLTLIGQLTISAQQKLPSQLYNQTWQLESSKWFAGVTVVFVHTGFNTTKAIWQLNGSGIPVLACDVLNVRVSNDSIFLTSNQTSEIFTFSKNDGLFYDKKPVRKSFEYGPMIFLWDTERGSYSKRCELSKAKFFFQSNTAYYEDRWYQITK